MLTDTQLKTRRIGGSDSAAVNGVSPWKTRFRLWQEKTFQVEPENLDDKDSVFIGNKMESGIRERYIYRTGNQVYFNPSAESLFHPDYPFLSGLLDGVITFEDGTKGILECKNVNWRMIFDWIDGPPEYYLYQVYHYMIITGLKKGVIGACLGGGEIKFFDVEYPGDEFINRMIENYKYFWNCVETLTPPEIIDSKEPAQRWPESNGGQIVATDEISRFSARYSELKQQSKLIDTEIDSVKCQIMEYMADNETLISGNGKKLHSWKNQTANRLDVKLLQESEPEIAAKYTKISVSRVFR